MKKGTAESGPFVGISGELTDPDEIEKNLRMVVNASLKLTPLIAQKLNEADEDFQNTFAGHAIAFVGITLGQLFRDIPELVPCMPYILTAQDMVSGFVRETAEKYPDDMIKIYEGLGKMHAIDKELKKTVLGLGE